MPEIDRWDALQDILTVSLFCRLSNIRAREYAAYDGGAPIPEDVQNRLDFIEKLVAILRGAYNDEGIRAWFFRKRIQLEEKCPAQILRREWDPRGPEATRVLDLARSVNV